MPGKTPINLIRTMFPFGVSSPVRKYRRQSPSRLSQRSRSPTRKPSVVKKTKPSSRNRSPIRKR